MSYRSPTRWLLQEAPRATWLDAAPSRRLWILSLICLVPLIGIGVRLTQLQGQLQPSYLAHFQQVREVRELLPAREGRILAADGTVLADDLVDHDLLIHYRWLEEPVDRAWLQRKTWALLSRAERRQSALVAAREQQVLARRQQLHAELSELTGHTPAEFVATARSIQIRVEKIWEAVERRLSSRQAEAEQLAAVADERTRGDEQLPWWQRWGNAIHRELTTAPARPTGDRLTIVEQDDYHLFWKNVPPEVAAVIQSNPQRFPGVKIQDRTRRVYPHRDLAAHLLGARTPVRAEEQILEPQSEPNLALNAEPQTTLPVGTPLGRTGLERQYHARLHGVPGERLRILNRHGEILETRETVPARHGQDVVLTLDLSLQQRAEQLLDRALRQQSLTGDDATPTSTLLATAPPGGCIVAIDVHTGSVLAAAAAPRFDANLLVSGRKADWEQLAADPRKPFYPRLTHMALPPGSVFKVLTAAALLETGTMSPEQTVPCIGYLSRPDQYRCLIYRHHGLGHGDTDLARALSQSCNVYFFSGSRKMGGAALADWASKFGIGQRTGIDLPSESAGHLPQYPGSIPGTESDLEATTATTTVATQSWPVGETLGLSIGQSSLTTTPLQIARMMAAVANGGQLVTPHLATSGGPTRLDGSESVRPVFAHPEPRPIANLDPATLAAIRAGLFQVVHEPTGTGFKTVRLREVTIAGKTGTAESGGGRPDHAWFAGFTPADQPRVAFAVVLEHGGSGSQAAGPIARELVRSLVEFGLVTAEPHLAEASN